MATNKHRPQASKVGNPAYMKGMQQIKFSNKAGPHPMATDYRRRPKHVKKGWE